MNKQALTETLFRAFDLGPVTLRNRVVMAPMTRNRSPGGVPDGQVAEYYRRRAAGGVGLIITEGTTVDHPGASGYPDVPAFHGEAALAGWRRVVEAVHTEGGRIVPQLWHVGSIRQPGFKHDPSGAPGYGPSAVLHPSFKGEGVAPRAMTESDIADVVDAFARGAADARRLGFDGVEIHGAHSYLIDQFFWAATNQRTDRYGGETAAERTRFAAELIRAVRDATAPDFPILFRFSQWKQGDYRHKMAPDPDALAAFLGPLCDAGVDVFHCSTRRYFEPEFEGSDLNLGGWTRKLTGRPTITVGSVGIDNDFIKSMIGLESASVDIDELLARLAREEFDLVAVGRALIADPDWVAKVRAGRLADTRLFHPEMLKALA